MMCILFFEPLCSFYEIPAGVLRGSGPSLYPALATITGTCCFRILWIATIFKALSSTTYFILHIPAFLGTDDISFSDWIFIFKVNEIIFKKGDAAQIVFLCAVSPFPKQIMYFLRLHKITI